MRAIFNRELKSYFTSATGYIFMAVFLIISGIFFVLSDILVEQPTTYYSPVLSNITFVFLILVPIITMRTLSEESHQKTDQLLFTSPVSLAEIILGKYLAAVVLFIITLLITCLFPLILSIFGSVSVWEIIGGYVGFALFGCSLIAIGIFISSLTESQIASAIGTFGALLFIWVIDWIQQGLPSTMSSGIVFAALLAVLLAVVIYYSTKNIYITSGVSILEVASIVIIYFVNKTLYEGFISKFLGWFSLPQRYDEFSMGMLNVSSIVYYISFSAAFIFLTIRMIEKRRWS